MVKETVKTSGGEHLELPDSRQQRFAAEEIIRRLNGAGHAAFFVGGCVRDLLLGVEAKDYDLTTSAEPAQIEEIFPEAFGVGKSFGVMLVKEKGSVFEVATFRRDSKRSDGRHPELVEFTSDPRIDIKRRDFTINAFLYDPIEKMLYDWTGGRKDLEAGLVRAIGEPEARFTEDYLRMLRCVRFAVSLDFRIEDGTFKAVKRLSPKIKEIARERTGEELLLILGAARPRRAVELLDETGLLKNIIPEVAEMKGVEQPKRFHPEGDVWEHTLLVLDKLKPLDEEGNPANQAPDAELVLGALLHDVGKPATFDDSTDRIRFNVHDVKGAEMADEICRNLRFSNALRTRVVQLVKDHMKFMNVPKMRPVTLKRFVEKPHFDDSLALHRADCLASHGKLDNFELARRVWLEDKKRPPKRRAALINGSDLIAIGLEPGPVFREILLEVENQRLSGGVNGREEALDWVRKNYVNSKRGKEEANGRLGFENGAEPG